MPDAIVLLGRTCLHFVLLTIPFLAACAFAIRKGVRDLPAVGMIGLAGTALPGYLIFWSWFLSYKLVRPLAVLSLIAGVFWLVYFFRSASQKDWSLLKAISVPFLLVFTSSLLILSTGFAYGGLQSPLMTATTRFSHPLPGDNAIPFEFLEGMISAHRIPEHVSGIGWKSSDRPPLQTAIALSQAPFLKAPRTLAYEVLSAILQSLWIFALWLLLTSFGVEIRATAGVLLICLLSEFVFLNTFYVWPKLIAAGYMLGLIGMLFTGMLSSIEHRRLYSVTAGLLLAWGMLSHGGSVFAALGLGPAMLLFRRPISRKNFLIFCTTAFVAYLPWIAYQKVYDPPGNRLLKMHLAGVDQIDSRSFSQVLISAYRSLTVNQIVSNKWENFETRFSHGVDFCRTLESFQRSFGQENGRDSRKALANILHAQWFFYLIPNLGFLLTGLLALLAGISVRYRSAEWQSAILLLTFVLITDTIWCLLMFGPRTTINHAGSYVSVLLAYAGCVLALWNVSKWLALVLAALQAGLQAFVYFYLFHPAGQWQHGMIMLALVGLAATLFLLEKISAVRIGGQLS